jgi:hypothetical protein
MMRLATLLAAAITLLLVAPPAAAAPGAAKAADGCLDKRGRDRCAAEQQRVRTLFGLRSIEEYLTAGDEVRRAYYIDGYGKDVVAIEFIRPSGEAPALRVHFPPRQGRVPTEPLVAAVDAETWSALLRRSELFDRRLAPLPEKPLGKNDEIIVCAHGWVYTVEASEPSRSEYQPARVRQRTESACDHGLVAFATEAAKMAVPLLPACARLDLRQYRNELALFAACGMLQGDRLAAAEVLNSANRFRYLDGDAADAGVIQGLFAYERAKVAWAGEAMTERDAAAFWVRKLREAGAGTLFIERVDGFAAGRVQASGLLQRWIGEADTRRLEAAPVEQLWVQEGDGGWRIEQATVGAFAPVPER